MCPADVVAVAHRCVVCVQVFHRYFNYFWLGLPKFLFPSACTALAGLLVMPDAAELLSRRDLSPYLRIAIDLLTKNGQTETDVKVGNYRCMQVFLFGFRRSIVIRTLVSAGELSLSCSRLLAG